MSQHSSPVKDRLQQLGIHLFEVGQLLTGAGRWLVGGLLGASLLGACVVAQLWGAGWMIGLAIGGGIIASVMMTIMGLWLAVWFEANNAQPFNLHALAATIPMAALTALGLIAVSILMGYWPIVVSALSGVLVTLALVAFPDRLARGPLGAFLWRHGGGRVGGGAARHLPTEEFEDYLWGELRGTYQREHLLLEQKQTRIIEALQAMTEKQARKLSQRLWHELLDHEHQGVRQAALRASRYREGETP